MAGGRAIPQNAEASPPKGFGQLESKCDLEERAPAARSSRSAGVRRADSADGSFSIAYAHVRQSMMNEEHRGVDRRADPWKGGDRFTIGEGRAVGPK